jgi:hypothetical protein
MRTGATYAFGVILITGAFSIDLVRILGGCAPTPVVPATPDATDAFAPPAPTPTPAPTPEPPPSSAASACQAACDAMALAKCTVLSDCAVAMCTANSDPRFKHYDTACLAKATSKAAVMACGVDCQ